MGYGIEFTALADEELAKLPGMVANAVLGHIERLAQDPLALGKPSHFPFLPGRQMYQFIVDVDGGEWWIVVFFRFSHDEQNIIVIDLTGRDLD